jgi:branched-chain amino acid transport system ATP-binding protein
MTDEAPLLRLTGVSKHFGGVTALRDVSFDVPRGKVMGIIGPNGAGKTSVFNVITGAYRADGGTVALAGVPIQHLKPYQIARRGMARTFQNIRLFASMTVWDHLLVAQPHTGSALHRMLPASWANPDAIGRAEEVLEFFGLADHRRRIAASLPYGIQRKVEMARALTASPRLLLLDEPVAGMNQEEGEELQRLLSRLGAAGLTILLIEHDMPFVMQVCDYLYVFDFGAVIAEGSPSAVRRNPVVLDAYLGQDA